MVQKLLADGAVLRGYAYGRDLDLERVGVFSYEHDHFDNWICGPFSKGADPPHPLSIGDLPAEARALLHASQLPSSDFSRDALVQVFEHGEAQCWGTEWVSTTGQRRETEAETPKKEPIPAPVLSAPYQTNLVRLAASYLSLVAGSAGILGDYLEEAGQSRIAEPDSAAERLDEILLRFFSPEERWLLDAEFVEHLLQTGMHAAEVREAVRTAIDTTRKFSRGEADSEPLKKAAQEALHLWAPEDEDMPERSQLAWAAWALANRLPFVTTKTCQSIDPQALQGQCERVLAQLDQKHLTS